jgi:hypothetical protein
VVGACGARVWQRVPRTTHRSVLLLRSARRCSLHAARCSCPRATQLHAACGRVSRAPSAHRAGACPQTRDSRRRVRRSSRTRHTRPAPWLPRAPSAPADSSGHGAQGAAHGSAEAVCRVVRHSPKQRGCGGCATLQHTRR